MRKFTISTPHGDGYYIHDDGAIERMDGKWRPSGSWRFNYLARTDGFAFGSRANVSLADIANGTAPCRYKNGSPRYTVADIEHGTARVWGNTKHHGISYVCWHPNYIPGRIAP